MINHIVKYFKLPHPLKKGKSITVSDPDELARTLLRIRADDKKSEGPAKLPRFLRVLISSDSNKAEGEKLVHEFETQSQKIHSHKFNWIKLKIFLRFTVAICLAYFLYWTVYEFHAIWFPSEWFINTFFGGSMLWGLFYGAVIILFPASFLITYFFGGKRWNRIHEASKYTKLFAEMGKDLREELKEKYIKRGLNILEKNLKQEKVNIGRIRTLVGEILSTTDTGADFAKEWTEKYDKVLEDLSCDLPDSLRGEITKLQDLKEDLLEFFRQGFRFMPLVVVGPSSKDIPASETDINLSILLGGSRNQAKNLREFLKVARPYQERIWADFELLDKARGKSERVEILESIQSGFERMRNLASAFHFGDNPNILHQRGRNVSDFYDKLYELVGKAKNDIREGKRQARALIFSKLSVKTEAQQKRRISRLKLGIERILGQETEHSKTYDRISHGFAWWGKDLARGIALTLILFVAFTCLLSFKVLGPDEVLVTRPLAIGVKETATQKERTFSRGLRFSYPDQGGIPVGFGKRLFLHGPIPLSWAHKVELKDEKTFTAYRVIAGTGPITLWQKGMSLLAGAFGGTYYEALEINFHFRVVDEEAWTRIDYDGQGLDRLSRDVTSILDEWQSQLFNFYEDNSLVDIKDQNEMRKIFSGAYFEKLHKEGALKAIIQRQISRSPFNAYQYGTVFDRINPGIGAILGELKGREAKIKAGLIEVEDKEAELRRIEEFKTLVEEYKDKIEDLLKQELGDLRKNPELLKKMLDDPQANIEELKDFETVWSSIQQVIIQQYGTDRLKEILSGELGEEKKEELLGRIRERINQDAYFGNLVEIVSIETKIHFMSAMKFQQKIQRVWMKFQKLT